MAKSTYTIASVGTYSKNRLLQFCAPNNPRSSCIPWMCKCRLVAVTAGSLQLHTCATAIVNGIPPGKYVLDRAKMRQH